MPMRRWLFLALFFVVALLVGGLSVRPAVVHAQDDEEVQIIDHNDKDSCLMCHSENVNVEHFDKSAHGKLVCQDCHKGVDRYPHPENATFKPACQNCHTDRAG